MHTKKFPIFLCVLVLVLASLACEASASTANITDAFMTSDDAGTAKTNVFAPGDIFYCQVALANAPDDTKVKAVWTAVEAQGESPNTVILEKELVTGLSSITFNLSLNSAWPVGQYKVDLYLNDKLDRTITFSVQ
jgi:hypothetical protein